MTGDGSSRIDKGKGRAVGRSEDQSTSVEPIPSSTDSSNTATYMASLSTEQRDTISEFVEATKEAVSVAIRTLQETNWDLLDAISQFGDDAEEEDSHIIESTAPLIEPIRPRRMPALDRRFRATDQASLRFVALYNTTKLNGIEFPRSQKSVLLDPISLSYSLLPANTPSVPMFISPYAEKMWYTGFMQP